MKTSKSVLAATELLLILPAALFMTALFVRNVQPQQYEPAHTAARIVEWYAASPHVGLWLLLILMPLLVLLIGGATLVRSWRVDADFRQSARQLAGIASRHLATLLVGSATLAAGGILAIVALHVLTN